VLWCARSALICLFCGTRYRAHALRNRPVDSLCIASCGLIADIEVLGIVVVVVVVVVVVTFLCSLHKQRNRRISPI
jgi:hypothetical protein